MSQDNDLIEQVVTEFEREMSSIESNNIWIESIMKKGPKTFLEAHNRLNRIGKEYDDQRDALRRALRRVFPTENQVKERFQPAAEKALQDVWNKMQKKLDK